jgi:glutamate-5-semialdehyde dehydrogenase
MAVQALDARVIPASDEDWDTEYLEAIVAAAGDGVDGAIDHIAAHGSSHHTDAIITEDAAPRRASSTRSTARS